jgi:MFS family permease
VRKTAASGEERLPAAAARTLRILSWFDFLEGFRLYAPVAVLYYARVAGSFAAGMSVFSAIMLASMILELPTGVLSDWIGRKRTIVLGAALSVGSVACYAAAPGIGLLLVGAVLEGAARAFYSGNNNALLYDSLAEVRREDRFHAALGTIGAFGQLALGISALAGSFVAAESFRLVMAASIVPQAGSLILSFMVPEPPHASRRPGSSPFRLFGEAVRRFFGNRRIVAVGCANMASNALGEACYQFVSAFIAMLWPVWAIGIARTLSNLGAAASFKLSGRLIDRFKELPLLIAARLYGRVVHVAAIAFPSVVSPVIMSSSSLLYGVSIVSGENVLQKEFSDGERATMGSIGSMGESLLTAVFSPLLGLVADAKGPAFALMAAQLLIVLPIVVLWREASRSRRGPPQPDQADPPT